MKLHEEFKLFENMWDESTELTAQDFEGYKAGTTTFDIYVEGSNKKAEGTYPGMVALDKILEFINGLSQKEKSAVGLYWAWDSRVPGDVCGDTIVYVAAPSEIEDFGGRCGSNLEAAEMPIRDALGISRTEPNILLEELWEDDFNSSECGTSSIEVGLDGYQGKKLLSKAGIPHKEAYEELLKVLKSVADKDLTELSIYWVADSLKPGDKAADTIVEVDGFQDLVDSGEDVEDAEKSGYDFRIPVNRLILPCAYHATDLGLPEDAYDVITAELTPADKRGALKRAARFGDDQTPADKRAALMYAARFRDDQTSVFYIGSKEDCYRIAEVTATSDFAKKHGGVTVERYYG